MFYPNAEMISALADEKRQKPLIIENVVIEVPARPSMWRKRCAAILRELAELPRSLRRRTLKNA
ncbi:MAG: hypothetical protein AAGD96_19160 [Chloroflexota bacterium]